MLSWIEMTGLGFRVLDLVPSREATEVVLESRRCSGHDGFVEDLRLRYV